MGISPGHALHEKGLQKQKSVGPLVDSQVQRALLVPRLNGLQTGCPLVIFVPAFGLHRISIVRDSGKTLRRVFFDALGVTRDPCLLSDMFCRRPVLPGPSDQPRRAPDQTRPWYVRFLGSTNN